ncbi:hypothetical protein CROQUDRAFT_38684, partial [Cronartium quercuum f. sp. fusiforme G11]
TYRKVEYRQHIGHEDITNLSDVFISPLGTIYSCCYRIYLILIFMDFLLDSIFSNFTNVLSVIL